ncbi:MAG: chlorohydrolase [Candidatus Syntrophoarchaeum sp. GoM_oil]|nr:MAG: chlorohydrolase [Candidatus Syntrophoarchaeum sp. GoM_oil]
MRELILTGTVIYGEDLQVLKDSYLVIREGIIKEVGSGSKGVDSAFHGIIIPGLVNAHTHIGDSSVKDIEYLPLDDIVKPPNGIKHRLLAEIDPEALVSSMRESILQMIGCGTVLFSDFRERGISGAEALREALYGLNIGCKVFGRGEVSPDLMDGIGISGASDMDPEKLSELKNDAKKHNMSFAIHAGEKDESDIDLALGLDPDILIHMVNARESDIKHIADRDIPLVICTRSNLVTGVGLPPLPDMIDAGVLIGIGTDNVMLNSPDILTEMEFVSKIYRIDDKAVFKMATINSRRILDDPTYCGIIEGGLADIAVVSGESLNMRGFRDPIRSIVRRGSSSDIIAYIRKGEMEIF